MNLLVASTGLGREGGGPLEAKAAPIMSKLEDKPKPPGETEKAPALFATIHMRSRQRPDGYSDEDIAELNRLANAPAGEKR